MEHAQEAALHDKSTTAALFMGGGGSVAAHCPYALATL